MRAWAIMAVALGLVLGVAVPSAAQRYPLPPGPYRTQCRDARVVAPGAGLGPSLIAMCVDRRGQTLRYALALENCTGGAPVSFDGSKLVCDRVGGGRPPTDDRPPPGSYRERCEAAVMNGPVLEAMCRDRRGRRGATSLNIRACRGGDITVDRRGQLMCALEEAGRLVLWGEPDWRGRRADIDDMIPDLNAIGFNDRAESFEIDGGVWVVCTEVDYRGRCERFDGSIRNLGTLGMAKRISSVRPARR